MAEQTLIKSPSFGDFLFDAVLNAEHNREVTVTSHPVQYGAEIADHSYIEPETVSLQIGMSDAMSEIGQENHSVNAYTQLVQMMEARELVTLVTRLGTYTDMLIVSMSTPDEFAVMNGIRAQIGFKHVNFVVSRVVLIQSKVSSSKGGYKPPETKTDDPEAEDKTENKSIIELGKDSIFALMSLFGGEDSGTSSGPSGLMMSWESYKNNSTYTGYDMSGIHKEIPGKGASGGGGSGSDGYGRTDVQIIASLNASQGNAAVGATSYSSETGHTYVKTSDGWKLKG